MKVRKIFLESNRNLEENEKPGLEKKPKNVVEKKVL